MELDGARKHLGPDFGRDVDRAGLNFETLSTQNRLLRDRLAAGCRELGESLKTLRATVDELKGTEGARIQEPETSPCSPLNVLTPKEREVLRLVGGSHPTKEITHLLGIAFRTAANHRSHIMEKLGIDDVAGLTRFAIDAGLIRTMSAQR